MAAGRVCGSGQTLAGEPGVGNTNYYVEGCELLSHSRETGQASKATVRFDAIVATAHLVIRKSNQGHRFAYAPPARKGF